MRIVEAGSFSRAGAVLYVAQPALSSQIAELEQELGMKLLVRGARGVRPTAEGELLYQQATALLLRFEQLPDKVRAVGPKVTGSVRFGMSSVFTHVFAGPLMQICKAELSGVTVSISGEGSTELMARVIAHELELALIIEEDPQSGVGRTELFRQQMYLLHADETHRTTPSLQLADLGAWPLISPRVSWRRSMEKRFAAAGVTPNIVGHTGDLASHLAAVSAGVGAILLPLGDPARMPGAEKIIATPIADFFFTGSLLWPQDTPLSRAAEALHAVLVPFIARYINEKQPIGLKPLSP